MRGPLSKRLLFLSLAVPYAFLAFPRAGLAGQKGMEPVISCSFCEQGLRMETNVTFDRRYTGHYRPGEPYDFVTVMPDGSGETFADTGIRVRVRFICDRYVPGQIIFDGIGSDYQLWSPDLCMCAPKDADAGPDAEGWVEWSGSLAAGGCATELHVFIAGYYSGTIPVKINSPDLIGASVCHTDASDFAAFVPLMGHPDRYDICYDFNESGFVLDASDLAFIAAALGASCQ